MLRFCILTVIVGLWCASNADAQISSFQKISATHGNLGIDLDDSDLFGSALTSLGDLNGDDVTDLAVGAMQDGDGGLSRGAVTIFFLNTDGSVKHQQKISATEGGFEGTIFDFDFFGSSLANLGDLDGDGITELAVGARGDNGGNENRGAVWILFLNDDGTVKKFYEINLPDRLDDYDEFGSAVANIGDLDGDGLNELAVGAWQDDDRAPSEDVENRGAVWILFLNTNGSVKRQQKISATEGGFGGSLDGGDVFGISLANLGDLDGDNIAELVVGATGDDDGGTNSGAVWILFLNADGTVKRHQKISATEGNLGPLEAQELFGHSVSSLGDLNGDGNLDLAVGAIGDDDKTGVLWILFLNDAGTIEAYQKISDIDGEFKADLRNEDSFGASLANLGDLSGDGSTALGVGASQDDDGGLDRGSVRILFLGELGTVKAFSKISDVLNSTDYFGHAVVDLGDMNGDGVSDLAVGAVLDDDGGNARGAIYILFLNHDGTVQRFNKISDSVGGFSGELSNVDLFGASLANLGDLDGDGIFDLAVGATFDDDGGENRGAVWILFLNADGSVKDHQKISALEGGYSGEATEFGQSLVSLGDLDGDGNTDLAVGAFSPDNRGMISILFLNVDGTVRRHQVITQGVGGFTGELSVDGRFGRALANLGDLNDDGVVDLAVGNDWDGDGGVKRGVVWILFLNSDGSVNSHRKISGEESLLKGQVEDGDQFGGALAGIGNLNEDNTNLLAVGAIGDNDGCPASQIDCSRGAVYVLSLNQNGVVQSFEKISHTQGGFAGGLDDSDDFGASLTFIPDLNDDGIRDWVVGAIRDDDGGSAGSDRGAIWLLFSNSPPQIAMPNTPTAAIRGQNLEIEVQIEDESTVSVEINIRKAGAFDEPFLSIDLEPMGRNEDGQSEYGQTIPGLAVSDRGLEYFITATDINGLSSRLPESGILSIQTKVNDPGLKPDVDLPAEKYRLLSIPLQLEDASPSAVLSDDLGEYGIKQDWLFFEPGGDPLIEYPATSSMEPGKAFWVVTRDVVETIDTGSGSTIPTDKPFTIALQEGWNYFGSPFNFSIPYSHLSTTLESSPIIQSYDGAWHDITGSDEIEPFKGYVVWSDTTESDMLFIDPYLPSQYGQDTVAVRNQNDTPRFAWSIQIEASNEHAHDTALAAIHEDASLLKDNLDRPESPLIGDYVSLYFAHQSESGFSRYDVDARPVSQAGTSWPLEVVAHSPGKITLSFDGLGGLPLNYEAWLVDEVTKTWMNLHSASMYSVSIASSSDARSLRLVVGTSAFVEQEQSGRQGYPQHIELLPNFPNPFATSTTIMYGLPVAGEVSIEVFNLLGQHVVTLQKNTMKEAGYHTLVWDGMHDAGSRMASGVYFVRLKHSDQIITHKVTLVK